MESALDFFRRGESILRIELQENEITLGEYAVKHSMLYQKAKEMEKEQIIDAHECGYTEGIIHSCESGEQYYNETFKLK